MLRLSHYSVCRSLHLELTTISKIIIRHKRIGYDLNTMRQSVCLVINPITVDNFAALFNCTPMDRASDTMTM